MWMHQSADWQRTRSKRSAQSQGEHPSLTSPVEYLTNVKHGHKPLQNICFVFTENSDVSVKFCLELLNINIISASFLPVRHFCKILSSLVYKFLSYGHVTLICDLDQKNNLFGSHFAPGALLSYGTWKLLIYCPTKTTMTSRWVTLHFYQSVWCQYFFSQLHWYRYQLFIFLYFFGYLFLNQKKSNQNQWLTITMTINKCIMSAVLKRFRILQKYY